MINYGWKVPAPPERKQFGIEAEFFGLDQGDAARALKRAGLRAEADGYHHETKEYWRVTDDSSVNGEGCELVSPILPGTENLSVSAEVTIALDTLRANGGVVDQSCGLHIHHDVQHMEPAQVAETVAHYAFFQPQINSLMHPARIGNEFGLPMRGAIEWKYTLSGMDSFSTLRNEAYGFSRYWAVNLQAVRTHGTLEFRQHAGTLKPDVALSWARFTRLFIDIAKQHTLEDALGIWRGDEPTVAEMCLYLGATPILTEAMHQRKVHYSDSKWLNDEEDERLNMRLEGYYGDEDPYCSHCDSYGHYADDCEEEE
jgi:hypothetical protein